MTQDEKLVWAAVYGAAHVELVGPHYISQEDLKIAVDVADKAVFSLRERLRATGSLHRNKTLEQESRGTTPVEGGIEL